jgi:hypothetical protein
VSLLWGTKDIIKEGTMNEIINEISQYTGLTKLFYFDPIGFALTMIMIGVVIALIIFVIIMGLRLIKEFDDE